MRVSAIAFSLLAATAAPSLQAGGQNVFSDPDEALRTFWGSVYAGGGNTLYCGKAFKDDENGALVASHIYNVKQIKSALRCLTDSQCAVKTPQYSFMVADLHNLYPALASMEEARRNAIFGEIGEQGRKPNDLGCDTRATYHVIEPRDSVKGDVARAFFYMHQEYRLPIAKELEVLKRWNQMDPPDEEEKARNARISMLQGTRNRFIDDPKLADQLTGE